MSNLKLLRERRYGPLFLTQFLGAFNDNFYKNAMVMLVVFGGIPTALPSEQLSAIAGGIFILPFFLFSATAGQLADRIDKTTLMRGTKIAELVIMSLGVVGFLTHSVPLLLLVLFFLGLQATMFGPSKYSVLPQLLKDDELVAGNAMIEMGTYLAILGGTLAGGLLIGIPSGEIYVSVGMIVFAILGWFASLAIPSVKATNPLLKIEWNPIRPTIDIVKMTYQNRTVWLSILGISWFWFFGTGFLSLFPPYTEKVIHGNETVATLFLALFSVGVGIGSMLCERLSRHRLELGLVPLGSLGLTVFTAHLFWIGEPWTWQENQPLMSVVEFIQRPTAWWIMADLILIAASGGFFIVPLYTLIQQRSDSSQRSRVIAGNNIVNSVFMVAAAILLVALTALGMTSWQIFLVLAVLNAIAAIYIYTLLPEFFLRFCIWILGNIIYRIRVHGLHHIPSQGPAVLVCNHVTFIDWLFIAGACKRPARFVMDKEYFDMPIASFLFKAAKAIPIVSAKVNPAALEQALDRVAEELDNGEIIVIFPEGQLTKTGEINRFYSGIEKIIQRSPVPVVPMALNGLWGSFFSRKDGQALKRPFRRFWSRISLTISTPVPADQVSASSIEQLVRKLWDSGPA